ncbi:hypothetical protein [Enterovibrio norvegicus]|uniref:Uncharacterized protein n=1 Tax=Enterovibrio norvegicus TaxID=188144 RepID=A0A2N7L3P6_9GAMM|nr:hypothetical protein [Enterovibrio norvegicus]PMN87964.1 hypothetical protein BCT23_24250 [Enterovibrio norvegicus]
MPVDKISGKPACDSKKVFIEVTGIDHNPEYSFLFYDHTDYVQQEFLEKEMQGEPETLDDTTVYCWDWKEQNEKIDVWLGIESESGTIRLPLYDDIQPKNRKEDEQDYLLHSVVPLTLLPTFDESLDYKDRIAPSRNGYLYVFYNNRIWREIEITTNEDGAPSFRDVDLYSYRELDDKIGKPGRFNPLKAVTRNATGKSLNEIWLPAKNNDKGVRVNLAFSEVQWSCERINFLEKKENTSEMHRRATAFHRLDTNGSIDVFRAEDQKEIRTRQPDIEIWLAEPSLLNHDLSGQWLNNKHSEIKKNISDNIIDGDKAENNIKNDSVNKFEYGIKHSVLASLNSKEEKNEIKWITEHQEDYLFDSKLRKNRIIFLDDPLFDLRHHAFLASFGIGYMQQIYVDMSRQPYYQCAELVQKFVMPEKFGEQENPFFEHRDEFDQSITGRYHRTLRTLERHACARDVITLQNFVENKINHERTAIVLRDISSLSDINASAAHVIVGYAISVLSSNINLLDQISSQTSNTSSLFEKTLLEIITSGSKHPLHEILFPSEKDVSLDEKYTSPTPFNSGSGLASTYSLAFWEKDNYNIDEKELEFIDLAFMSEANDNNKDYFPLIRRVVNITDGILKGYFDTLQSLSKELNSSAKVIAFNNAYSPVLRLMKATNSKLWGDIIYTPTGGSEFKGTVLGVHGHGLSYGLSASDREYIKTKKKNTPMGRLINKNGKLIAATGKRAFKKSGLSAIAKKTMEKLPLKVVVLPESSPISSSLSQKNTQRALKDFDKWISASNAYERLKVPYFIVIIELLNLKSNWSHVKNMTSSGNDVNHSRANALSAILDLGIAITHASNLHTRNASWLARESAKTLIKMPKGLVAKFTFQGGSTLVSQLSRLGALSLGAGLLTAGIAGWDAIRSIQDNDIDAGIAMGMVAIGTVLTTLGTSLFSMGASAPVLFGMGPIAWLGIAIAVGGFALYVYFKDSPIEVWLKNGPFGQSPSSRYSHLQDNQIAFDRFIGILFNISIESFKLENETDIPEDIKNNMVSKGATHAIWINTNLASFVNPEKFEIQFFVRQAIQRTTSGFTSGGMGMTIPVNAKDMVSQEKNNRPIIGEYLAENGNVYFVNHNIKAPETEIVNGIFSSTNLTSTYQKSFISRTRIVVEGSVFPSPNMDDSSVIPYKKSSPKFSSNDKYWIKKVLN